jgi:hypothetical protein
MNNSHIRTWRNRLAAHSFTLGVLLILVVTSMNSIAQDPTLRQPPAGAYAQPPIGQLRWKAPRARMPFEKTFVADSFSDICPQLGNPLMDIDPSLYGKKIGSEDCGLHRSRTALLYR